MNRITRPPPPTNFEELFNRPTNYDNHYFSPATQPFNDFDYNLDINNIVKLEESLKKKVFNNRENQNISYNNLKKIVNEDNLHDKEIKRTVLTLFLRNYELYDRKLKKGLTEEEDIIEHMEVDNDPTEGVYLPLHDEEIILYLDELFTSPEIVKNAKKQ